MSTPGQFSYPEIRTQAASWQCAIDATLPLRQQLVQLVAASRRDGILFTGCGSTHYLAQFAAPFFQGITGIPCRGLPASELALQTETVLAPDQRPLVIALSRSGETSETIMAVQRFKEEDCSAVTISCYDQTPLSQVSDLTVAVTAGQEQSFAQTRSFAGMLVAVQVLAALVAPDAALLDDLQHLPALAADLIARADPLAQRIGRDESIQRITYLGSGALYGLASEATVKMKEMSLSLAEPYHFMEFRHGPMSLVDPEHLVVALLSERRRDYELAVLRDLRERGARILAIAQDETGLADLAHDTFCLRAPVGEAARAVLYLPMLQLLAYHRAIGRGLNPDRPRNVVMAIQLTGTEMIG